MTRRQPPQRRIQKRQARGVQPARRRGGLRETLSAGFGFRANMVLVSTGLFGMLLFGVSMALRADAGGGDGAGVRVIAGDAPPGATSTPTAPQGGAAAQAATSIAVDPGRIRGLAWPIAGACLPANNDNLWPGAPRTYRNGVHEGIDFYPGESCAQIEEGTPILAVAGGLVVRADHGYSDLTEAQHAEAGRITSNPSASPADRARALDLYRGRQVWLDLGNGVVVRYAHLSGIAPGIEIGKTVRKGEVLGYVGNSGTPESLVSDIAEMHLHFEIRVGERFLGQGLSLDQVKELYEAAFAP
jgi:murein DD-endopeptidase MepM/ murein hydrolase activator NlpD